MKKLTYAELYEIQARLQDRINEYVVANHGEKLGRLAIRHLNEAARETKDFAEGYKYLETRRNESRSWELANRMFGILAILLKKAMVKGGKKNGNRINKTKNHRGTKPFATR